MATSSKPVAQLTAGGDLGIDPEQILEFNGDSSREARHTNKRQRLAGPVEERRIRQLEDSIRLLIADMPGGFHQLVTGNPTMQQQNGAL